MNVWFEPWLTTTAPEGAIVPRLQATGERLLPGEEFELLVTVDLGESDKHLGSYGARLRWNQRAVKFLGATGGQTAGFRAPLVNLATVAGGEIRFADANPMGAGGNVELIRVRFRALRGLRKLSKVFDLEFTSLGAPGPRFENLAPLVAPGRDRKEKPSRKDKL